MKRVAGCFGLLVALTAGAGWASSIGLYFASDGSDCDATVGVNEPFTLYVLADLYGDALAPGTTGAQFSIRNWPPAWPAVVTPSPAPNIVVGNPLLGGTNIGFLTCQIPDANGFVLLYTIDAVATTPVSNLTLYAWRHTVPIPENVCPMLSNCEKTFDRVCVVGGAALINGPPCNVAVRPATWSNVKVLYGGWD